MFSRRGICPIKEPNFPSVFGFLGVINDRWFPWGLIDLHFDPVDRCPPGCANNAVTCVCPIELRQRRHELRSGSFPPNPTTPTRSMTRRFMVTGRPRGSNNAMPSFMLRNVEGWCGRRPPPCAAASRARRSPGTCGGFEQAHQLGFRAVVARRIDILAPFRAFIAVIGNDDTANSIGRIYACTKWAQFSIASKEEQP
ncbi:hypothetical protein ABIA10_006409 [Rhizobium leguminosarum]